MAKRSLWIRHLQEARLEHRHLESECRLVSIGAYRANHVSRKAEGWKCDLAVMRKLRGKSAKRDDEFAHYPRRRYGRRIMPDEIRNDLLAVAALSRENDGTIELFSLRLVDGHDLNAIWIIHSIENQILSESVVENVACARTRQGPPRSLRPPTRRLRRLTQLLELQ